MRDWTVKLGGFAFAGLVVGALGFGVTQAFASSDRSADCQPCDNTPECRACCVAMDFEDGECFEPNCLCF